MSSSSHSDSDSDREPNSLGARVFWGNLKTPERSKSNFVDPPKTVVKSNRSRRSTSLSALTQGDHAAHGVTETEFNIDNDEVRYPESLHEDLANGAHLSAMDVDVERNTFQPSNVLVDHSYEDAESSLLRVPPTEPSFSNLTMRLSDVGSESEVEDAAVLRPSSPIRILVDEHMDTPDLQGNQGIAHSNSPSPILAHTAGDTYAPRDSQLFDLISFDMSTPTRLPLTDLIMESPLPSRTLANEQTSSLAATIEDLLCYSTQRIEYQPSPHPSPPLDYPSLAPSNSTPKEEHVTTDASTSEHSSILINQPSQKPVLPAISSGISTHTGTHPPAGIPLDERPKTRDMSGPHVNSEGDSQTPERMRNIPQHMQGAETRKRAMVKASKCKAKGEDGSDSSGEPSSNSSNSSNGETTFGETADKAIKKERRIKAKQEAERKRPLLMSLSPTSADVLTLLASPERSMPSPPRAFSEFAPEHIHVPDTPVLFKIPATPHAGPSTPARRVPITLVSPRRHEDPPLHLTRAQPVNLEDPNRTPARRLPLPTPTVPIQARPLPLDDPNRTPARRIVARPSSVMKTADNAVVSPFQPRTTKVLPVSLARQVSEESGADIPNKSSLPMVRISPVKRPPSSGLGQPSLTSASEAAEVAVKPYARSKILQSKLPKLTSSRIPVPGTGFGHTANAPIPSRSNAPSNAAPSRIPSPIKREAPSIDINEPTSAPPTASRTGSKSPVTPYQRKRQRMITEDGDSDEPPAKRPMIVVPPVKKSMFNKTALDHAIPSSSTSRKDISPVRPARASGPLQFRPVIRGTLGHFETTRSSSRDLSKNAERNAHAEENNRADTEPLSSPTQEPSTPLRGGSPSADTDTSTIVTTRQREPTLDDMSTSSTPGIGREPSFGSLAKPEPELRRTTRVRKLASATMREPVPLTRTTTLVSRGASSLSRAASRPVKTPSIPVNQRQLQALTQANTARNQLYVTELQRRVVRKEGPRPASPTTKVRTIMEKAREASSKGREARAERRRRRGEGSGASTNSESDSIDYKDVSSSPPPIPRSEAARKHVRGPGDEEDYETPERPLKPSLLDPSKASKNVKWDRSLARSLSELAAEQAAKQAREGAEAILRKGCLARDAKTLRLDPLGNVPDANTPLDSLGREPIIVTRFIYDDDDDIEATRAAKKKKT